MTSIYKPFGFTDEKAIEQAVHLSLQQHEDDKELLATQTDKKGISSDQFTEKIRSHSNSQISGENRNIVVNRASIWATALPYFKRKNIAESKGLIQVEEEEDAVDLGGPKREFLHLLLDAIFKDSKTVTGTFYINCLFSIFFFINSYRKPWNMSPLYSQKKLFV